jgi:AraC-like DNA-binding protein
MANAARKVNADEFYQYLPGVRTQCLRNNQWKTPRIDRFNFPSLLGECAAPAVSEHMICFSDSASNEQLIRGECKVNGISKFKGDCYSESSFLFPEENSTSWSWKAITESPLQAITVYISPALLNEASSSALNMDSTRLELLANLNFHDPLLRSIAFQIEKNLVEANQADRLYVEALSQIMLIHLLKHYTSTKVDTTEYKKGLHKRSLNIVVDYIRTNINGDIALDDLAKVTGISPYYFSRLFRNSTGVSPYQYVVNLRLEQAAKLLRESNLSILDIGIIAGYENLSSFSTAFKKKFCVTPSGYRNSSLN